VRVMDVDARHDLADVLPSGRYFSIEPAPDNKRIYYTLATEKGPRAYYTKWAATLQKTSWCLAKD